MTPLRALIRKNRHATVNLGRVLQRESRLKVGFILCFAVGMMVGLFALFLDGFRFLSSFGGAGFLITRYLFALFFMGLGTMLVLSGIVSSYSTLFRSRETHFLLVHPVSIRDLITYKFGEATILSSWAFFFVIIPFTAAYAWHEKLGAPFLLWTMAFSVPLLVLCSGLGALISLILARWFPRGRYMSFILLILIVGVVYGLQVVRGPRGQTADPSFVLSRLVPGLKMASAPLMPSWWTAEGIMECSRGNVARGLAFLGVLVSNAMVMALAVQSLGAATFYSSLQRVLTAPGDSRRRKMLFPRLERLLGVLSHDIRAITMKDIRTFFRDPVQWSQALIFFGLLALYFGSIRSFNYHELPDTWRNLITFLNVFSVAAVQCSLASRFIFPQLSLEGHAFWLLGLSPITPRRILWTKFMLAAAALLAVSVSLMSLSTGMLRVLPAVRWIAVGITASISLFVAALSTGLGAVFLDLRQPNPTAIVSGLGGTINLVLSLLYMLLVIVPFGLIFHLAFMGHMAMDRLNTALLGAGVCVALLTVVGTAIPLWMGHRSLAARDF